MSNYHAHFAHGTCIRDITIVFVLRVSRMGAMSLLLSSTCLVTPIQVRAIPSPLIVFPTLSSSFFLLFLRNSTSHFTNNKKKHNGNLWCPMGVHSRRAAYSDIPSRYPPPQHLLCLARNSRLHGLPPGYRASSCSITQGRQGPSTYSSALGPGTPVCPCHVSRRWFLRKYVSLFPRSFTPLFLCSFVSDNFYHAFSLRT